MVQPISGAATASAVRSRLKTRRNEPCPCGSGRKYKKCCLSADERLARQPVPFADLDRPSAAGGDRVQSGSVLRLDELWHELEATSAPAPDQVDELLDRLLALPGESTNWHRVFAMLAVRETVDLAGAFRRIVDAAMRSKSPRLNLLYGAAAAAFAQRHQRDMLVEIATGFQALGTHYDADVLWQVMEYLLAEGLEAETLALAEHFLPIVRNDDDLMAWSVSQQCELIFELRVGRCLQQPPAPSRSIDDVAADLLCDLEEDVDLQVAHNAAAATAVPAANPPSERAAFTLPALSADADRVDVLPAVLRLHRVLIHVAREAWEHDQRAPGAVWWGLMRLCDALDHAADRTESSPPPMNLLDSLSSADMESWVARATSDFIGVNVPRARLLLDALEALLHTADRHGLLSRGQAEPCSRELQRLRSVLEQPL